MRRRRDSPPASRRTLAPDHPLSLTRRAEHDQRTSSLPPSAMITPQVLALESAFGYKVRMTRDSSSRDSTRTFDVLIVGRRGDRCVLVALRMAAHGLTVCVLEAGPRFSGHSALQNTERRSEREQDHVVRAITSSARTSLFPKREPA